MLWTVAAMLLVLGLLGFFRGSYRPEGQAPTQTLDKVESILTSRGGVHLGNCGF
jgi:hypothetical protein